MLAQWGGIKPIVFEYAHAGQLPGDEVGVSYHFNTCLGWDTATNSGLFADGDNIVERTGGTALVTYSEANLATAGLCGMLVGEYVLGGVQMAVPSGWTDDAATETLKAPNGVPVVRGMRLFVLANNWDASDVPVAAEIGVDQVEIGNPSLGKGVIQWFEKSGQLSWVATFNNGNVFRTYNGQEEKALRAALDAAQAAEASAQSAATQAQQSAAAATAGQQTAQASLSAANAQIAQLQAQIAALKSQPAPAPIPAPAPANPAPTTPADAAALLVSLIYAEAAATLKAAS